MPRFQLSKTAMSAASRMVTVSRPHIRTATPSLLTLHTYSTSHNSCFSSLFSRRPALSTNNTARESLAKLTIPTLSTQMRLFSASASLAGKRATYRPSRLVQKRRHGFLARLRTRAGRKILMRRRLKGRKDLSW